jgi:hypothetical protein
MVAMTSTWTFSISDKTANDFHPICIPIFVTSDLWLWPFVSSDLSTWSFVDLVNVVNHFCRGWSRLATVCNVGTWPTADNRSPLRPRWDRLRLGGSRLWLVGPDCG